MKKILALCLASMMMLATLAGCSSSDSTTTAEDGSWAPSEDIEWVVTSSSGGGSDIYTRLIADILKTEGIVDETFLVNNQTDGGGEIGRNYVATANDDGHMLLTMNSGDLLPMITNTSNRIENFKVVAIMAVDRHLLLGGTNTKYASLADAIEAAKGGETVVITGSKGDDDVSVYNQLIASAGLTEAQMPYLVQDSTGDAITMLLGGHAAYCIAKPAASAQYIESGDAYAEVALAHEAFSGDLADVPLLDEACGIDTVECALWRGIVAPASTPDEAIQFWSDAMAQVVETDEWLTGYIEANMLTAMFMPCDEASEYMAAYQAENLA